MKKAGSNKLVLVMIALLVLCCCAACCGGLITMVLASDSETNQQSEVDDSSEPDSVTGDTNNSDPGETTDQIANAEIGEVVEFSGTFEEYDSSCAFDLQCRAKVEGQWIVTNPGFVLFEELTLGKFELDPDTDLGKEVNVRAEKTLTGFTLVGSADYYIVLAD